MSKQVLIIDDDSRNIFALSAILKTRGYTILSANGMEEAFRAMDREKAFNAILIDMMMPDMDGYQAIPAIRDREGYQSTPIVAVTAQAMKGDREKCLAAGADEYIPKPVDIDQLMQILKQYE